MSRIGKRILLITFGIVSFLALYTTAFAAPTYEYQSNWSVTVDFVGDQPNAILLVEAWKYDANTDALLETFSETRQLSCEVRKGTNIVGGKAHFEGGRGIQCAMPSIQNLVYHMTKGEFTPEKACACKSGAVVSSDVTLAPNITAADRENPIAVMEDIQFASPLLAYSSTRANLNMRVGTVTAVSPFYVAQLPNNLVQGSFTEINPPDSNVFTYVNAFTANGEYLAAAPGVVNAPLYISNNQPSLSIGYNSQTGEGLYGVMSELFVDPGCSGNGGSGGV